MLTKTRRPYRIFLTGERLDSEQRTCFSFFYPNRVDPHSATVNFRAYETTARRPIGNRVGGILFTIVYNVVSHPRHCFFFFLSHNRCTIFIFLLSSLFHETSSRTECGDEWEWEREDTYRNMAKKKKEKKLFFFDRKSLFVHNRRIRSAWTKKYKTILARISFFIDYFQIKTVSGEFDFKILHRLL